MKMSFLTLKDYTDILYGKLYYIVVNLYRGKTFIY